MPARVLAETFASLVDYFTALAYRVSLYDRITIALY